MNSVEITTFGHKDDDVSGSALITSKIQFLQPPSPVDMQPAASAPHAVNPPDPTVGSAQQSSPVNNPSFPQTDPATGKTVENMIAQMIQDAKKNQDATAPSPDMVVPDPSPDHSGRVNRSSEMTVASPSEPSRVLLNPGDGSITNEQSEGDSGQTTDDNIINLRM
jgi:hypothetical protein